MQKKSAKSDDFAHAINKNNFRSNKFFNNRASTTRGCLEC